MGIVTTEMPANTAFKATLAGIRNPRYLTNKNNAFSDSNAYRILTYDSSGFGDTDQIDLGIGGSVLVEALSHITTFSIEP